MIILRQKIFRRDPFPKTKILTVRNELIKKYGKPTIALEYNKQYKKDINSPGTDKIRVRNLIKDIKNDYLYDDGPNKGDTHFLEDFSDPLNKKINSVVFSKKVNNFDRLNYRIYNPRVISFFDEKSKTNKTILIQRVEILSCRNHNIPGQGDYLHDKELRKRTKYKNRRN